MKTLKPFHLLMALVILTPGIASAQWNMVRFDQANFFIKNQAITPNSLMVTGFDQNFTGSFFLRTNDGGITWDSLPLSTPGNSFQISTLHFTDVNNGLAGGLLNNNQVLLRTTDNGDNWIDVTPDPVSTYSLNAISFTDPLTGYVSDQATMYKTVDGGQNWLTLVPGFGIHDISFINGNLGFASGDDNTMAVVMRTTDGGQTWTNLLSATAPFFSNSNMGNLDVVSQDIVFASMLYTPTIFRTTNGGLTWDTLQVPVTYEIQDFDFINANEGHILSTMGEIFGTVDGGVNWILEYAVSGGFYGPSIFLNSISFSGTTGYVCGSDGLIKKYTDETTGLTENHPAIISMYPNPVTAGSLITIEGINGEYTLEIYNRLGQVAVVQKGTNDSAQKLPVSTTNLTPGVYVISINNGSGTRTGRMVIVE